MHRLAARLLPISPRPWPWRCGAGLAAGLLLSMAGAAWAQQDDTAQPGSIDSEPAATQAEYSVVMQRVEGEDNRVLGRITLRADESGLRIIPELEGLPAGPLALQLHQKPDCGTVVTFDTQGPGEAAGPRHEPEQGQGQESAAVDANDQPSVGELPPLSVDEQGRAVTAVTAAHVRLRDVAGRSLVILADPAQSGGKRLACGIIRN